MLRFLVFAHFLLLHLSVSSDFVSSKMYDKRDDFVILILNTMAWFQNSMSGLIKSLLHQGLSEPKFYSDLVYRLKKIMVRTDFSDQFRKIIIRHKRIGYDLNVMRQSACLVINPITVDNFAAFFNSTLVDRASDSMMAPT